MRLDPEQVSAIKQAAAEAYGPNARVCLFGSRTDDRRRGGDIDLYIETDHEDALLDRKLRFMQRVWQRHGPRRIDVLVHPKGRPLSPIDLDARAHGIEL